MSNRIAFSALTDQGPSRNNNEDSFAVLKGTDESSYVVILADGMGGHQRGELASSTAVNYCQEILSRQIERDMSLKDIEKLLSDVVAKANVKVYLESLNKKENNGMGTTLTVGLFIHDSLVIAHVGDCRAYQLRGDRFEALTVDHTLVQAMVEHGDITAEEAQTHPRRNVVTRALGTPEFTAADLYMVRVQKGDRYLFSSDGLHDYVRKVDILKILKKEKTPDQACASLVSLANSEAGADNVTVICGFVQS